jgi:hypothetical protein
MVAIFWIGRKRRFERAAAPIYRVNGGLHQQRVRSFTSGGIPVPLLRILDFDAVAKVAVNFSGVQLRDTHIQAIIVNALADAAIAPFRLEMS